MALQFLSIKNCESAFKCPRAWERLTATANDNERHCASCDKLVYLCHGDDVFTRHVKAGHCVAVEDVANEGSMLIGQVESGYRALSMEPNTPVSERLTNSEIEQLQRRSKELDALAHKAFK